MRNFSKNLNATVFEQGTWTPFIEDTTHGGASSEGQTYSNPYGAYAKIGNTVFINGALTITSIGTLSGSVYLGGLPYANSSTSNNTSGITIGLANSLNITAGYSMTANTLQSETYIELHLWDSALGNTNLSAAELSDGGAFIFSGHYTI